MNLGDLTMAHCDVAVVGAAQYGLSLAAHLRVRNVHHRIVAALET